MSALAELLKRMKARKNISDELYDAAIAELEGTAHGDDSGGKTKKPKKEKPEHPEHPEHD